MLQFFTGTQFTTSMELGLLYGLVALALYISFGLLKSPTFQRTAALRSAAPSAPA